MSLRASIVLTSLTWVLGACAGPSGPSHSEVPGFRVSGESITVVEFSQEGAQINYRLPHDTFGLAVAEEIAGALRKRGHRADAIPSDGRPAGTIIVSGRVVLIEAGSRAKRYWVGFGAGAAKFGVVGSVSRPDGTELASFVDERWSGFGVFGGNSVSLVQKCLRAVGNDVAKMIHAGSYRQK